MLTKPKKGEFVIGSKDNIPTELARMKRDALVDEDFMALLDGKPKTDEQTTAIDRVSLTRITTTMLQMFLVSKSPSLPIPKVYAVLFPNDPTPIGPKNSKLRRILDAVHVLTVVKIVQKTAVRGEPSNGCLEWIGPALDKIAEYKETVKEVPLPPTVIPRKYKETTKVRNLDDEDSPTVSKPIPKRKKGDKGEEKPLEKKHLTMESEVISFFTKNLAGEVVQVTREEMLKLDALKQQAPTPAVKGM